MVPQEFQAIVLAAGKGTRFSDLTEGRPKCLLPVGRYPVIFYPLHMLQRHGFTEAIVVVLESQRSEVQHAIDRLQQLTIKVDFVTISSENDFGTADTLRHISERVVADLLVISCDVVTNASLFPLINKFREQDASLAVLLLSGGQDNDVIVPGPKSKEKPERDMILTNLHTSRLLFLASLSDFEEDVQLPAHLLRANGKVQVETKLLDAHVYIIKKWIVDFLAESEGFSTLKGELLPYVVKKQMSRPSTVTDNTDKPMSDFNVSSKHDDIFNFISRSLLAPKIAATTLYSEERSKLVKDVDMIKCYAVKAPKECFGLRINTVKSFCAANQKINTVWADFVTEPVHLISPNASVESTQIVETVVNDGSKIASRTSIKNSVIGGNCTVDNKVRISNCVLMNNVTIEEG